MLFSRPKMYFFCSNFSLTFFKISFIGNDHQHEGIDTSFYSITTLKIECGLKYKGFVFNNYQERKPCIKYIVFTSVHKLQILQNLHYTNKY